MSTSPHETIYCAKSRKLCGKRIIIGLTGSIAAVEMVRLIRELIREGAEIVPVMSDEATRIVHPNAIEFAAGTKPITEITGRVEHVTYCSSPKASALLLIAPCSANTISKIATGLADTPVTIFAATALGAGIPTLLVPSMNAAMYRNRIVEENIRRLRRLGVHFIEPKLEETKAKFPELDTIVATVIRLAGNKQDFVGKRVLIITGRTEEPIDDVRVLTNRASGRTGLELAKNAFERGAEVELWAGRIDVKPPSYISVTRFQTVKDLERLAVKTGRFDLILVPAAISDYTVQKTAGKLDSTKGVELRLKPTKKILSLIRKRTRAFLVGFKVEYGVSATEIIDSAYARLKASGLDMIVANDLRDVKDMTTHIYIIDAKKTVTEFAGTKTAAAERILDEISTCLAARKKNSQ